MKVSEVINTGLYGHIANGAKVLRQVHKPAPGREVRTITISANDASYELAMSQETERAIDARLAKQHVSKDDDLTLLVVPKVRVAIRASQGDIISGARQQEAVIDVAGLKFPVMDPQTRNRFLRDMEADVKRRYTRVFAALTAEEVKLKGGKV